MEDVHDGVERLCLGTLRVWDRNGLPFFTSWSLTLWLVRRRTRQRPRPPAAGRRKTEGWGGAASCGGERGPKDRAAELGMVVNGPDAVAKTQAGSSARSERGNPAGPPAAAIQATPAAPDVTDARTGGCRLARSTFCRGTT